MIVFFSGTGNSRYAAKLLADRLQDQLLDAAPYTRRGEFPVLTSEKPWVIAAPTYAWRIPHIFEEFLRRCTLSGSRECWFVMTCGSDTGAAGRHLAALCREKGLVYHGVRTVVMPENYLAMFSVPDEAEAAAILAKARPVLEAAAESIREGTDFTESAGPLGALKSGLVNRAFYRFFVKADGFSAGEDCVGCGMCAEACPLANIRLMDGRPVWGQDCTHCMACICGCPVSAIEYGRRSRKRRRYQCPEYEE